ARVRRFVHEFRGAIVVVSHDRAFLDDVVTRIVAFDPETRRVREFAGGWSEFERERELALARERSAYAQYAEQRDRFETLLGERRGQAQAGAGLGERSG